MKSSSSKQDSSRKIRFSVRRIMKHRNLTFVNGLFSFHSQKQISADKYVISSPQFKNVYGKGNCHCIHPKKLSGLSVRSMRSHKHVPLDAILSLQVCLANL